MRSRSTNWSQSPTLRFAVAMRPEHAPAERELEVAHRRHRDGVDELLVELRIALVGIEAVGADVRSSRFTGS